ncbi:MAG: IS1634 family transposase [Bacteroidota bacterium]
MVKIKSKTLERNVQTKVLNHLGLVAGMNKEIGIGSLIDSQIPSESPDKILSTGTAIEALILNGLGYVNKRLYLVSHFFKNKPVDKLLGVSYLNPEHLNDDALGRALDAVYAYGVSELYTLISGATINLLSEQYGLSIQSGHLDNTSFHLHGKEKSLDLADGQVLEITYGNSKDHRPDLVQIGLQLICEHHSRIPLMMKVLSGNQEEGKSYGNFVEQHVEQLQQDYGVKTMVVDSKLYNQKNLALLEDNKSLVWLTRVPHTIKAVKEALTLIDQAQFRPLEGYEDYTYQTICNTYGEVKQRWFILYSHKKQERDLEQFCRRVQKQKLKEHKAYKKLSKQEFDDADKAMQAAQLFCKKLKYNNLECIEVLKKHYYQGVGKPKKGQPPKKTVYRIEANLVLDQNVLEVEKSRLGYFILATNELEQAKMSAAKALTDYKNQSSTERGFRFLKDPNIVASSLFVQKPQRMMAMVMIMTLCLLVYSALEFKTRFLLKQQDLTFDNQIGKPVQNPSMKWIFESFEGIHVLYQYNQMPLVLNLEPQHKLILDLLGPSYWHFYT